MPKKSTKNVGNETIKSKDELLKMMNDHLTQQQAFAMKLKNKALQYIDEEEKEDKKKRNQFLSSYNMQVDAVSRTASTIIKIYNSELSNGEEDEKEKDNSNEELVS